MPIRINLLAEQLAEEEQRRRDPLKRAFWIGGFLVALVLLWSGSLQLKLMSQNREEDQLQRRWKSMETNYAQLESKLRKSRLLNEKLNALNQLATNRFLVANALNALQLLDKKSLPNVHLTQIRTVHLFDQIEAVKQKKNNQGKVVQKAQPAQSIEKIKLVIEGRDYSSEDREIHSIYPKVLEEHEYFKENLAPNGVLMRPVFIRIVDPTDPSRSYRVFSLECKFPDKVNVLTR